MNFDRHKVCPVSQHGLLDDHRSFQDRIADQPLGRGVEGDLAGVVESHAQPFVAIDEEDGGVVQDGIGCETQTRGRAVVEKCRAEIERHGTDGERGVLRRRQVGVFDVKQGTPGGPRDVVVAQFAPGGAQVGAGLLVTP